MSDFFDGNKLCGFDKQPCKKHECAHYAMIQGKNPQTGEDVNEFACVFSLQLLAQLEANKIINRNSEIIQSFRNETKVHNDEMRQRDDATFAFNLVRHNSEAARHIEDVRNGSGNDRRDRSSPGRGLFPRLGRQRTSS